MTDARSNDAFAKLMDTLYYGGLDERDKGSKFERLMRSYLMTDPAYASDFDKVWLWDEYPDRDGRTDTGIDLVAQRRDGTRVAIQTKFYDPEHVVRKQDLDSFISASATAEFSERLFVSTTLKDFGPNAEAMVKRLDKPMQRLGLQQLESAPIDWAQFSISQPDRMVRSDSKKSPRPHQQAALEAIGNGFKTHDRGKLIMACGTGKTYTALQVVEQLTWPSANVLFLVPSIALLSQTLTEWKRDAEDSFHAFAVCSDVKVGKNVDGDVSTTDLLIPATTSPEQLITGFSRVHDGNTIAGMRDRSGRTIVFSTYQSIDVISQAQQQGFPKFDLVICDEAHRTTGANLAGQDESAFTKVHNNDFLRADKRLYMTATPRVFEEAARKKAEEQSVVVASMDDEALFGPEFYRLGFGEAVEKGLLTDYKVLVLAVDETSISRNLQALLSNEDSFMKTDEIARLVGCWKALGSRGATADAVAGPGASIDEAPLTSRSSAPTATPSQSLRHAVAFATNIKESQHLADSLATVSEELARRNEEKAAERGEQPTGAESLTLATQHVDGSMNVALRNQKLSWLADRSDENETRILTNARCLSEGVDVPNLDAVLFLNPRNSQVDVVQSVGRVMRRAADKEYGYIVLPVAIKAGDSPEQALKDSKSYKVIWSVLNALRSHDDRFEAMINKIDLQQSRDASNLVVETLAMDDDGSVIVCGPEGGNMQGELEINFSGLDEWQDAIYAKIVQKVGDREYWENWSGEIARVAQTVAQRIAHLVSPQTSLFDEDGSSQIEKSFDDFVEALRANLNDGVTREDAVSMLAQHIITKPVFDALFEGYDFAAHNPVSQVMDSMVAVLDGYNLKAELKELDGFYRSVARRAEGIDNAAGKQRIITELYENFFKKAFPKQAEALGIVYTPIEVVDFILRSVDDLSRKHFGKGITDEGVHVLDPFTGTGTFIVRLLQSGIITQHDLARKYANELHANELMLLAYYVAAINIEATYHGVMGGEYKPFEGIVLADTFQMTEDGDTLDTTMFTGNNERAVKQLNNDIQIIVGNPPYSAGQTSANDNNANQSYPTLDEKIRSTYAAKSKATLKNSLYDSYIRAIRWATDRLGDTGVLGYVTNGGYIDSNTADGLRKSLAEDFQHLYIFNLRGNQRTSGEQSRKEGGKIFDAGSRATVAVMFAVKDPAHSGSCQLHYRDIGDYLNREEKLQIVEESLLDSMEWQSLKPNERGEWINQSSDSFETYYPLNPKLGGPTTASVFLALSGGLKTNRDAWVYGSSEQVVHEGVLKTINTYAKASSMLKGEFPDGLAAKDVSKWLGSHKDIGAAASAAWSAGLRSSLARGDELSTDSGQIAVGLYRPFFKQKVYFDRDLNERPGQLPRMFPGQDIENLGFYVPAPGSGAVFSTLATDKIPDLCMLSASGQFFSRYTYEKVGEEDMASSASSGQGALDLGTQSNKHDEVIVDGYRRVDNISDDALARYREAFGGWVSKDDIFASIYALLHSEQYRTEFAADLKRQLPRVPLPSSADDFREFVRAGEHLLDLHIRYEDQPAYPLDEHHATGDESAPQFYRVQKMRWAGKARTPDKSSIVVNANVTLTGIPDEAHEYMLGSRSALEWILDRYQLKTDKASGIVNDPNDWGLEHGNPRYIVDLIKKVTTVSVETMKIVHGLPELDLG